MNLLLHPLVKDDIDGFLTEPTQSLLISGRPGTGKLAVANHIGEQLIGKKLETYPYFRLIKPEKGSISIDAVRELQGFLGLKTTGNNPIRRLVIIEGAGCMTNEAQNALLKSLEEPPADTVFILTVTSPADVLPTILSRCRLLRLRQPGQAAIFSHFNGYPAEDVRRAYYAADGGIGLMSALLAADGETHPLKPAVELAKKLLAGSAYERLCETGIISKDKSKVSDLLFAFDQIYKALLRQASENDNRTAARKAQAVRRSIAEAKRLLEGGASPKLLLTSLLLDF